MGESPQYRRFTILEPRRGGTITSSYVSPLRGSLFHTRLILWACRVSPLRALKLGVVLPWAYAHGYYPSPLRGSEIGCRATVGLCPRLLSVAPTGLACRPFGSELGVVLPWAQAHGIEVKPYYSPQRGRRNLAVGASPRISGLTKLEPRRGGTITSSYVLPLWGSLFHTRLPLTPTAIICRPYGAYANCYCAPAGLAVMLLWRWVRQSVPRRGLSMPRLSRC